VHREVVALSMGSGGRIAEGFAAVAGRALGRVRAGGLVLTGGQTARAVCDALAIAGIELVGEIERGVALGRAVGARARGRRSPGSTWWLAPEPSAIACRVSARSPPSSVARRDAGALARRPTV
jgi:hypothetical protein